MKFLENVKYNGRYFATWFARNMLLDRKRKSPEIYMELEEREDLPSEIIIQMDIWWKTAILTLY